MTDYHTHAKIGDVLGSATLSIDKIATFMVTGADRGQVAERLERALEWFYGELTVKPEPEPQPEQD